MSPCSSALDLAVNFSSVMVGQPFSPTDPAASVVEFEETNLQAKEHHETALSLMTMIFEEKKELDPSFYEEPALEVTNLRRGEECGGFGASKLTRDDIYSTFFSRWAFPSC